MKIGLAQIDCEVGDVKANCQKISEYCKQAKSKGCDLVIFPEMVDTGYIMSVIQEVASEWPDLPFNTLKKCAEDNSMHVLCGISEREEENIYNSQALFSPTGELLAKYRKTHLFSAKPVCEELTISPGDTFCVVDICGIKCGLSICYDLRFPELYRQLALDGAEVLINSTAWPHSRPHHWDHLTRTRAIENQCYFVGVDRVGLDGDLKMNGCSRIVEPMGDILIEASSDKEELIVGDLDLNKVSAFRNKIPVFKSRRADIYG